MRGRWQKKIPRKAGLYWVADRKGYIGRPKDVAFLDGKWQAINGIGWVGWWWSEPIPEPSKPPPWEKK